MSDHILWPIVAKYLAGECSPREMSFMETWLEQEENHQLFQEMEKAWRNQQVSEDHLSFDVDRGLNFLYSKIEQEENRLTPPTRLTIGVNTWFAAASVVLILGMAFNFYKGKARRHEPLAIIQKVTGNREMVKLVLPDSSVVWLNKKSILEYPSRFEGKERMVVLKGDAFFEVTHNKEMPFVVSTNGLSTKVLGTSFEIKAYPGEQKSEIAVKTGKVKVSGVTEEIDHPNAGGILPGQKLVVDHENLDSYIGSVSTNSIAQWRLDPLIFRDNTYQEVAAQLEMRFEKKIRFNNINFKKCRVMASFNRDASLEDILKLLSISNSFQYVIGTKDVTISGGICH